MTKARINTNWWNRVRYTLYAPFYDHIVARIASGRRRAIDLLDVKPGERVLISGCGTGLDLELLPRGCHITAIDITPAMVEKTRARATALGLGIDAQVMDAANLSLPDASFDCVLLHLVLAVVPDPNGTAREAARVLRPGGRASIFDKFLPDAARPSLPRRVVNTIANVAATNINRRLGDVVAGSGLTLVTNEPSVFRGMFRVAIAVKSR